MRNLLFALSIVTIAAFAAIASNAQQAGVATTQPSQVARGTTAMQWEYKVDFTIAKDVDRANKLGAQGWELVAVVRPSDTSSKVAMYFKRPLRDSTSGTPRLLGAEGR